MRSWLDSLGQCILKKESKIYDLCYPVLTSKTAKSLSLFSALSRAFSLQWRPAFHWAPVLTNPVPSQPPFLMLFPYLFIFWLALCLVPKQEHPLYLKFSALQIKRITKVGIVNNVRDLIYKIFNLSSVTRFRYPRIPLSLCLYIPRESFVLLLGYQGG